MTLITYPAPAAEAPSPDFLVSADGRPVFVYQARVSAMPVNQVWPGYQRPLEQTELASFAYLDLDGPVQMEVVSARPVETVTIRPLSYGIRPEISGNTIRFELARPCQVVVEVNGWHHALHLFANPLETDRPDPDDPRVRYFGPGLHEAGRIELHDGETVYLAGGAVVHGVIHARGAHDIRILGRGILDASRFGRFDAREMIELIGCSRALVSGIILRDPHIWTVKPAGCEDVTISNIKIIGLWRYNADGIDIVNSRRVLIEDCFVRSFDDSIVVKGMDRCIDFQGADTRVQDVRARNCVIWNDWGRGLELGAETQAEEMSGIVFENCDIVHFVHRALDIQAGDRATISDVRFVDIRVEDPIVEGAMIADRPYDPSEVGLLAELILLFSMWNKDTERGHIRGVQFKDIRVLCDQPLPASLVGYDAQHRVEDVDFDGLWMQGRRICSLEEGIFQQNEHVRNVRIR